MSRKNHKMVDGKLLQMDKKFTQLKMKQREKISAWYYDVYRGVYAEKRRLPTKAEEDMILDLVLENIRSAEIWIPAYEVENHFDSKKARIRARMLREYWQDIDYELLINQANALMESETHMVPLLSNLSALLNGSLTQINWVGFYLVDSCGDLVLGPFQGKVACTHIPRGKGVCGTALDTEGSIVVSNVHEFSGHIACDSASLSEIVVPIKDQHGQIRAVLDIDSPIEGRFFEQDRVNLEKLCALIGEATLWELQ